MITSKDNAKIKYINKLKQKKFRDKEQRFLIFGEHLIMEALNTNQELEIYTTNPDKDGILISEPLMKQISFLNNHKDVFAVVSKPNKNKPYSKKILILDDVQDPTNVGALIRSAVGFGFETIIVSNKSADFYNEKVISSSQGAIFHANLVRTDLVKEIEKLKKSNYQIIGSFPLGGKDLKTFKAKEKFVLILGNEGSGIKKEVEDMLDEKVKIETTKIESLNVAVAGAIFMYKL
ncbi:MAG: RNA methyltransferase [Acholeplasmataceae bacterium]|nr:RNA methyltransferase [Acholeplasmataceae bacterium]